LAIIETVNDGGKGWRRRARKGTVVLASALGLALALAPMALGAPKGVFARFAQCPTRATGVALCLELEVTGGMFSIGKESVPIERPILLRGGAVPTGSANFNEYFLVAPTNGQSIVSANELELPGGLQALLGCTGKACYGPYGASAPNAVVATIQLATSPANRAIFDLAAAVEERGTAVRLPVRVQLHNPLLGSACYLGSEAQPIQLRLTDGTTSPPSPNRPIAGTLGRATSEIEHGYEAVSVTGVGLVDNIFSVPVAKGCGGSLAFLIDPEIDRVLGLESPAGHNTAILKGAMHMAEVQGVLASEVFPGK
jgi:hypothetical protein